MGAAREEPLSSHIQVADRQIGKDLAKQAGTHSKAKACRGSPLCGGIFNSYCGSPDYGFSVLKLKAGEQHVHPMAFSFPRRDDTTLFFPTIHIHDSTVTEKAKFDHCIYAQLGKQLSATGWKESPGHANSKVDIKRAMELVAGDQHVYCQFLRGRLANQDTWLKLG